MTTKASKWKRTWGIATQTVRNWSADNGSTWAAALAFYTMMSAGPLVFVAVGVAGMAFGKDAASDAMVAQASALMGPEAARALQTMMQHVATPGRGLWTTLIGLVTLVFGATGVFSALQDAMDAIWHVQPRPDGGVRLWLKKRLYSASMVFGLGFLLMTSLALNAAVAIAWRDVGVSSSVAVRCGEFVSLWALGALLVAGIFKVLPDVRIAWRSVWTGAFATALLLNIGKHAIGTYLGNADIGSAFGAAGSLALLLVWVYYAAQVLLLGASFTRVWAKETGEEIEPDRDARAVERVVAGAT